MLKKIQRAIRRFSILLGLFAVLLPQTILAQEISGSIYIEQLDTDTKTPVQGVKLGLYKIADRNVNNGYELTEDFLKSEIDPESLGDSRKYKQNIQVLEQYIKKNQVSPVCEKISDQNGAVCYTGVADGIYFVRQNNSKRDFEKLGYSYTTDPYMLILPWTDADGNITRKIFCKPKGKTEYPKNDKTIAVYKVWKDDNNKRGNRPSGITAGLYCDGELQEKITLNSANNWTYQWTHLDAEKKWEIKEINVPAGYLSEVTLEGNAYTITNTWIVPPTSSTPSENSVKPHSNVKTGDSSRFMFYAVLLSGAGMVLAGIWIYRSW